MNHAEVETLWRELTEAPSYRTAAAGPGSDEVIVDLARTSDSPHSASPNRSRAPASWPSSPPPKTYGCLEANLAEHLPGTTAFNMALGAAELIFHPCIPSSSTLFEDEDDNVRNIEVNLDADQQTRQVVWQMFDVRQSLDVEVSTVSRIIREQGVERIGLLKVDVERGETEVLKGIDDEHWPTARRVLLEVHDIDGRLDETVALPARQGLTSDVSQFGVYAGGSVHLVLATRD
ncbi:hypothetical protein GCM10023080_095630 [Streptomyces pseudoechinosporeus]